MIPVSTLGTSYTCEEGVIIASHKKSKPCCLDVRNVYAHIVVSTSGICSARLSVQQKSYCRPLYRKFCWRFLARTSCCLLYRLQL